MCRPTFGLLLGGTAETLAMPAIATDVTVAWYLCMSACQSDTLVHHGYWTG